MTTEDDDLDRALMRSFAHVSAAQERDTQMQTLLTDLLGVVDALRDLEKHCAKLEAEGSVASPLKSIETVTKLLLRALRNQGVEPMNACGDSLDLSRHEVLSAATTQEGVPADIVLAEQVHGYLWNERVLRHAKVVISKV